MLFTVHGFRRLAFYAGIALASVSPAQSVRYTPEPGWFIREAGLQPGEAGTAQVRACFDTEGKVTGATIRKSSGNPRVDAVAVAVASASRFRPAVSRDRPRAQCVPLSLAIAAPATPEEFEGLPHVPPDAPELGPVRIPAKVVSAPAMPRYDSRSISGRDRSGRARVQVCVDETGKTVSTTLAESSGDALLDQEALLLARQHRFEPATEGGKPVASCPILPITFY